MKLKLIILSLIGMLLCGCATLKDLSNKEPYSKNIHKKYKLTVDCFVVSSEYTEYPKIIFPGSYGTPKKAEPQYIGKQVEDYKIIDILPRGTEFEILRAMAWYTFENWLFYYEVLATNGNHKKIYSVYRPTFNPSITFPPVIDSSFAVPVPTGEEGKKE